MSNRLAKVNSLIKKELGQMLQEIERPRDFLITIISVKTSVDLRYATISISVTPNQKNGSALRFMRTHLGELQKGLYKKLNMRPIPRLRVVIDEGEQHASRIEQLLAKERLSKKEQETTDQP